MGNINRGDIYYAQVDKYRPVIVVSNHRYNDSSDYVTVVPISSKLKRLDLPIHVLLSKEITGEASMVMAEHYYQLKKEELKQYVCTLSKYQMKKINDAIKTHFELF